MTKEDEVQEAIDEILEISTIIGRRLHDINLLVFKLARIERDRNATKP